MSDGDIALSYNRADDKREQIKILAELNATSKDVIIDILSRRKDVDISSLHIAQRKHRSVVAHKTKPCSEDEFLKIKELYDQGMTDGDIASTIDRSISTIRAWRLRNNLLPNQSSRSQTPPPSIVEQPKKQRGRSLSPERHQLYLDLYNQGLSDREISVRTGLAAASSICVWRLKNGLLPNGVRGRKKKGNTNEIVS